MGSKTTGGRERETIREDLEELLEDGFSKHPKTGVHVGDLLPHEPRTMGAENALGDPPQKGLTVSASCACADHHVGAARGLDKIRDPIARVGAVGIDDDDQLGTRSSHTGLDRGAVSEICFVVHHPQPGQSSVTFHLVQEQPRTVAGAVVDDYDFGAGLRGHGSKVGHGGPDPPDLVVTGHDDRVGRKLIRAPPHGVGCEFLARRSGLNFLHVHIMT